MKNADEWPVLIGRDRVELGLARRPPAPEVTVASRHPEVLELWSDDNLFGPDDVAATAAVKVLWTCPEGHRFIEAVRIQCSAVARWRQQVGGSRACKSCYLGSRHDTTTLRCGHVVKTDSSVDGQSECWTCKQEERQQRKERIRQEARSNPRRPIDTVLRLRTTETSGTERR